LKAQEKERNQYDRLINNMRHVFILFQQSVLNDVRSYLGTAISQ